MCMAYKYYNPNPLQRDNAGDCSIRAITKVLEDRGFDWEKTYAAVCTYGFMMGDVPSSNDVWGSLLEDNGFQKFFIDKKCKDCFTINSFCNEYPSGKYVVGTGNHAVAVVDGCIYDTYRSGDMIPIYYFVEKET